jgi:hypothetical protein
VKIHLPALGPDLPIHPFTGLTALGRRRNGAPIWPVKGGAPDDDQGDGDAQGDAANNDDGGDDPDDLGDAGKRALDRMKADRNAARQELKAVRDQLAKLGPLQKLADALGAKPDDGPTDVDALTARLAKHEEDLAAERALRWRAEVAQEKGLTAAQAKRLVGKTRDELAADADDLLKTFAAAGQSNSPRGPRPDPSQGNRGGKPVSARDAALAEIEKRFGKKPAAT